jgi:hypothetical protein
MANREEYLFNVDANVDSAIAGLKRVEDLMKNIERIKFKGITEWGTTTQKDRYSAFRSMSQITKSHRDANKQLRDLYSNLRKTSRYTVPSGADDVTKQHMESMKRQAKAQMEQVARTQLNLRRQYKDKTMSYREIAGYQTNYSKNFKPIQTSQDTFNLDPDNWEKSRKVMSSMADHSDNAMSKLNNLHETIRKVKQMDNRNNSLSARGAASRYLNYQQAMSFKNDFEYSQGELGRQKEVNIDKMTKDAQRRTVLSGQVKEINENPKATEQDQTKKILLDNEIKEIDAEREARMELNRVLEENIANMKKYKDRLVNNPDGNVEVKPERGTTQGMAYERASSIGLTITGILAATIAAFYGQGAGLSKAMRPDVMSMGQRTGMVGRNWNYNIQDYALKAGLANKLGFSGQEMLDFQNNYLSNKGYTNMGDLRTAMQNQAVFSRTTGIDANTTKDVFGTMFNTGAMSGGQIKTFQDAFVGAIKRSGMEGREKQQLTALQNIVAGVSQGRNMSNKDIMNLMGIQTIMASTGSRALSGTSGGQLMNDLNTGIKDSFNNPAMRLVFGMGTKYQGLAGRFALRKQMDKGISDISNVNTLGRYAMNASSSKAGQNEVFASLANAMGVSITGQQAQGMMNLVRSGKFTQSQLNKVINDAKSSGKKISKTKLKNYQNSAAGTNNQSDATTQKQEVGLYDLGQGLRTINATILGKLNPALYVLTGALVASTLVTATSSMGLLNGSILRKFLGGNARNVIEDRGWGYGGGFSGTGGGAKGWVKKTAGKVKGWFWKSGGGGGGTPPEGGGGGASAVGEATAEAGRAGGWLSKAGKVAKFGGKLLGRVALPLAIMGNVMNIASAPKDQKGKAVGKAAGSIAGGWGGALAGAGAGAAIGSIIPGIGTVIGGAVGGIIGGFGGSGIGGWLGGKVGSVFDPKKAQAATLPKGTKNSMTTSLAHKDTETKAKTEDKKTYNIVNEKTNLDLYGKLLNQASTLLSQARMQNGIFGNPNASGSGGGSAGQVSGSGNGSKIWNFLAGKGMSSSAIAGVMGNLQQESGLNPNAPGGGLAQWIGGRQTQLKKYAKAHGLSSNSIDAQLGFMWKEMSSGNYGNMSSMNNMTSQQAAKYFEQHYEKAGIPALSKRESYAQGFYNKYATQNSPQAYGMSAKSGKAHITSTINIHLNGNKSVAEELSNSTQVKNTGAKLQQLIYGSMNYYSQEVKRV